MSTVRGLKLYSRARELHTCLLPLAEQHLRYLPSGHGLPFDNAATHSGLRGPERLGGEPALVDKLLLDLVLDHADAEPLIPVRHDLLHVQLPHRPGPVHVLHTRVDERSQKDTQEKRAHVRLLPKSLLLEEVLEIHTL